MLDQHPGLAANISLVSAMAPIAYNYHTRGLLRWTADFLADLPIWLSVRKYFYSPCFDNFSIKQSEFLPPSDKLDSITSIYCQENSTTQNLCYNFLFTVTG